MKSIFKLMLLFSMLLIASAVQASDKHPVSPPECTVMVDQHFDITNTSVFVVENQYVATATNCIVLQTYQTQIYTGSIDYNFIRHNSSLNNTVRSVYINEKFIKNLLPLPFVRYMDKSNSINHYNANTQTNRLNTTRHV